MPSRGEHAGSEKRRSSLDWVSLSRLEAGVPREAPSSSGVEGLFPCERLAKGAETFASIEDCMARLHPSDALVTMRYLGDRLIRHGLPRPNLDHAIALIPASYETSERFATRLVFPFGLHDK